MCWNGTPCALDGPDINFTEPCSASQVTPGCLRCVRDYIQHAVDNNQKKIKCFAGCHIIYLDRDLKRWQHYGEMGRHGNDHPCISLARALDDVGEGITQCRKCGTECGGVYNLGMHIKYKCSHRNTKCKRCKKSMKIYELEEHAKECYLVCSWCDEQEGVDAESIILGKDGMTDHHCPYKTLAKCRFCQKPISMDNIQSHKNCSLAKKGDLGIVCKKDGWKHNFRSHTGFIQEGRMENLAIWGHIGNNEFYRLLSESRERENPEVYDVVSRAFYTIDYVRTLYERDILEILTIDNEPRFYTIEHIQKIIHHRQNFNEEQRRNLFGHREPISSRFFGAN